MKTIYVDFSKSVLKEIAKQGDHNQTQLVFTLPDTFSGANYVNAEFVKRDKTTAVVEQLTPSGGIVTVPLTQELTDVYGRIVIQLVAYAVNGTEITEIAKSDVVRGVIKYSLNVLFGQNEQGVIERFLAFVNTWTPKLTELWAAKHTHTNKATLDTFYCPSIDAEANTPEGQLGIGLDYTGWNRYYCGGGELRMCDDGGVVQRVETVTVNDKSFLRLWMHYGEVPTIQQGRPRPDYIDIPIDSATDTTVMQGELMLNGTELDFGVGELEADSHTHTNKAVLDDFGTVYVVPNSAITAATYETRPINGVRQHEVAVDGYSGAVYAGAPLTFQTAQTQAITITALTNNAQYFYPEYVIEFTTGATAPTLTLPASVEWADELTVEANKHYQISIVNNIALWCAVDVEVEEEEE